MLREVTYESVLKRLRKIYHGLVADWLIANSADRIGEYFGLIAEHLLFAGKDKHACEYFFQAGESALASYANTEAEGHFRQAFVLSPDNRLKADILYGLGEALYRQAHPEESVSTWRQAIDLYTEMGDYNKLGETYTSLSWLIWYSEDYSKDLGIMSGGAEVIGRCTR